MQKISCSQKRVRLRELLNTDNFIVAPAVHDFFSLRLVEQTGYSSACISGAMLSYSLLGFPDIGLLTLTECVEHCRRLTRSSSIPITADADAGYGNARGVYYAVELFEEAGAAGINIEDQLVPKRWGSQAKKEVVSIHEMEGKIRAAERAREDDNFLIIARTDACGIETIDRVIERARAYESAGADALLPIGPRSESDIARLVQAVNIPVTLSAGTGLLPAASAGGLSILRLRELGVRRVSLTTLLPGGSIEGMQTALTAMNALLRDGNLDQELRDFPSNGWDINGLFNAGAQSTFEDSLLR
jgi:2-methylisocitrate lyase-like PEP mutase family enzyme